MMKTKGRSLREKYPPSQPCSCDICRAYCIRPGWWSVEEASRAIDAGLGDRMMLEIAPDFSFGVLSPAFRGCELNFALQIYARRGCNFLSDGMCELHGNGLEPLECCFSHHLREGQGPKCHSDLEQDWNTPAGRVLVNRWIKTSGLWERYTGFNRAGNRK